jgi:hypothetical protein
MEQEEKKDVIAEMLEHIKRFYMLVSLPTIAFFALFYFTSNEALVADAETQYIALVCFFLIALIVVPTSSIILKRAVKKGADKSDEEQVALYEKAYKIRIWSLAGLAYLSGPMYMLTCEDGCIWMFIIAVVVLLLSYPSRQYILRDRENI